MQNNPVIVIKVGDHLMDAWVANMKNLLPGYSVHSWREDVDKSKVAFVIAWTPDALWVNSFPQLQALVSVGSGVDHIENLERLREDIPVIRTVSADLTQRMREFMMLCVLSWHRQLPQIFKNNEHRQWERFAVPTADKYKVGVLGFGRMGRSVAESLQTVGYDVSVWARAERADCEFEYSHGRDQLGDFAGRNDVLICLLPLTEDTTGILDYSLMKAIRSGGCLINAARGAHLVDEDLARVMAEGHLSAAYLDGFRTEPLPSDSPLYDIENVCITFHSAAYISPESGPLVIAENIRRFAAGEAVEPMYDRSIGY